MSLLSKMPFTRLLFLLMKLEQKQ